MWVKPLIATTRPEIRVAASWISDARLRTEHAAAVHRNTASSAGPSIAVLQAVQSLRSCRGFSDRVRDRCVDPMSGQASLRSPLRARPVRWARARRELGVPRTTARKASTAASCASVSLRRRRARVARSPSSSLSSSSVALRSIAEAGLFNSWARPADSLPSESIFSSCRSLDVNMRARSSIVCTRIDVIV